ncbi:MAG TPA: diacylglycerol kinase family protein [Candidatus Limnocylindrales bacterium]|nr:diacylglycerol kinase family protein [Candidatus Limnocylindrales bacterium]
MRVTLFHNPGSGDEPRSAAELTRMLEKAGFQVRYQSTKKSWKKAIQLPADIFIAAGGDGTVTEVIHAAAGSGVPVAPLPIGTANNIARTLGIVGDAREIVEQWRKEAPRPFDIGTIKAAGLTERFVEGVGGGVFADAVLQGEKVVDDPSTLVGHVTDRALTLVRQLLEGSRPARWGVEIDGRDHSGDYLAVEVLNIRFVGPSIPLAAHANPGDGRLDVALLREEHRPLLLKYLTGRLEDASALVPDLPVERGREIRLDPPGTSLRMDDTIHDELEGKVEIGIEPGAVAIL